MIMFRVLVDGSGTDSHPLPEIQGAIEAVNEREDLEIISVVTRDELSKLPEKLPSRVKILEAETKVSPYERPSSALFAKKNSTIATGLSYMHQNGLDGFLSAGNTGAVMAFAFKTLGRLKGVKRPSICALFPTLRGYTAVLDVGANVDSKPEHLVQFGIMGYYFVQTLLGISNPRVALLSIGEESVKGNEQVKMAKELFEKNDISGFSGYVEGKDVLMGKADVVVTDGFIGNTLLKFGEGTVEVLIEFLKNEIKKSLKSKLGALLLKGAFREFKEKLSYERFGGAPLLGINGNVIICHGRSSPRAIKNAIFETIKLARENVNQKIQESLKEISV